MLTTNEILKNVKSTSGQKNGSVVEVTIEGIDKATLASELGDAFVADTYLNNGYPILKVRIDTLQNEANPSYDSAVVDKPKGIQLRNELELNDEITLPLVKGYVVTSEFGTRVDPVTGEEEKTHYGIDLSTGAYDEVFAIADGYVTYVGENPEAECGYCIEIRHEINGNVFYSFYAHLNEKPELSVGDMVEKGQLIGIEGETGKATGIHLHFEIRTRSLDYSSAVDPRDYLVF